MDNRQTRRMLEKMGMNLEELPNVEEVIIKTKERDLIIKEPQVSQIKSKAMNMFQIIGNDTEEIEKEIPSYKEEDILLVSQQANVSPEEAQKALEETNGDLAQAILKLK
ncbi:MAG: nascent polypeptide-associated complex protein [Thaumarchaeota archaeon]|nr:nascent polypeptide-associated complex protein [Nitrososphaerota archaeon]